MRQVLQEIQECRTKLQQAGQALEVSEAGRVAMQEEFREREEAINQVSPCVGFCSAATVCCTVGIMHG